MSTFLPVDSKARKDLPVATGVVDYFPLALVAIAELSRIGNDKHNPGEPLHWARGKGGNNADELMRHFIERGSIDKDDGVLHSTKVAWRALALLQLELEAAAKPTAKSAGPTKTEAIDARLAQDPCGFGLGVRPGHVFMCSCGADVRHQQDRPDQCRGAKKDAVPKPEPGDNHGIVSARPLCGFDYGKHTPGVNVACAKCYCTIGDELRPAGCKHWIVETGKALWGCSNCGVAEGLLHKPHCKHA